MKTSLALVAWSQPIWIREWLLLEKIVFASLAVFPGDAFTGPVKIQAVQFATFWADTVDFRLCDSAFFL